MTLLFFILLPVLCEIIALIADQEERNIFLPETVEISNSHRYASDLSFTND